jgi:hypothetical protein
MIDRNKPRHPIYKESSALQSNTFVACIISQVSQNALFEYLYHLK